MKAILLYRDKRVRESGLLAEAVIWRIPKSERYPEGYRYRLVLTDPTTGIIYVLFDNHAPKGHHRHGRGGLELKYDFVSLDRLMDDYQLAITQAEK